MGKIKVIIILILVALAFGAGAYFKNDVINFYNNFNKGIQDFKKTDIGSTLSEIGKEVLTPPPLQVNRKPVIIALENSKIIEETNLQRELNGGLPALTENAALNEAALAKANDMFTNQYFEHISPAGVGPGNLVLSYGYNYIVAGENLILGNFTSEKEMVQDWMNSPGHRENILNNRYAEIGVAVIKGTYNGEKVWISVQEFGLSLSACPSPSDNLKYKIDLNKTNLDNLSLQINNIKDQINNMNPRRPDYNQTIAEYNNLVESYNSLADETKEIISQYNSQVNNFNNCVIGQ